MATPWGHFQALSNAVEFVKCTYPVIAAYEVLSAVVAVRGNA